MEVHHHPDIHHKSKKWKEYFLEFLMIFLAVTMGFIAENIRERLTEKGKEKQYIEGFVRNLKEDTANGRHVMEADMRQASGLDSIMKSSHADMAIDSNRKTFYYNIFRYCYTSATFKSNEATLQQLKSTGDYRLIEKDHVADSLSKFDGELQNVYVQGNYYEIYFKEILSRLDELADISVLGDTSYINNGKMTNKPLPALRTEGGKLATFFNKIFVFKIITTSYVHNNLEPQLEALNHMIAFLQKKYGLKD